MPHCVRWPFGYTVTIKYKTRRQMAKIGLEDSHGAWVGTERAIYVQSQDHVGEQCETIAHELQHAATDYRHFVDQYVRMPLIEESAETMLAMEEDEE